MAKRIWNKKELDYLAKHYGKKKPFEIAEHLNRTESAIHNKAHEKGIAGRKTQKAWSEKEINDLIEFFPITPTSMLTMIFDRPLKAIQFKAWQCGLLKEQKTRKKRKTVRQRNSWTEEEIEILRRDFPHMASHEVPIKRTTAAIKYYAKKLGIKKTAHYIQKCKYRYALLVKQGKL